MTTKTDEQERADFEVWLSSLDLHTGNHERQIMFFAYQAGRAALQSQDRGDAERLDWMEDKARRSQSGVSVDYRNLVEDGYVTEKGFRFMSHRFIGGCFKTIRGAIDHARRIEDKS